jgi:hypothetical protein
MNHRAKCTFTKYARANTNAALISSPMRWHSGKLWYGEPDAVSNAVNYAKFYSRSHHAVIRVYDAAGNVIETHKHLREFKQL